MHDEGGLVCFLRYQLTMRAVIVDGFPLLHTYYIQHEMAWTIGGAFVVATVPISLYQIFQHLSNFVEPRQQTHVIRMISMVPLYAIQSWFSLRYQNLSLYTQCVREVSRSAGHFHLVDHDVSQRHTSSTSDSRSTIVLPLVIDHIYRPTNPM